MFNIFSIFCQLVIHFCAIIVQIFVCNYLSLYYIFLIDFRFEIFTYSELSPLSSIYYCTFFYCVFLHFFFKDLTIYLIELERERQRGTEIDSICWFTSHTPPTAKVEPSCSLEPGASYGSPLVAWAQTIEPSFPAFPRLSVGSWIESGAIRL